MCASYGLNKDGDYTEMGAAVDAETISAMQAWAEENRGATLRPTGIRERKLLPMITAAGFELGWWGHLVGGQPAKYPSINTRSERVLERPGLANGRTLIPATSWFEMQKPSRTWYAGITGGAFAMAAVTQAGRPEGGDPVTCYSLVMQEAHGELRQVHDRVPVILPVGYYETWLDGGSGSRELVEGALEASREMLGRAGYRPRDEEPGAPALF